MNNWNQQMGNRVRRTHNRRAVDRQQRAAKQAALHKRSLRRNERDYKQPVAPVPHIIVAKLGAERLAKRGVRDVARWNHLRCAAKKRERQIIEAGPSDPTPVMPKGLTGKQRKQWRYDQRRASAAPVQAVILTNGTRYTPKTK